MNTQSAPPLEVTQAARTFGERLRTARMRRRMTQDELASASGITRKTLYALENGSTAASLGTVLSVLWKLGLLGTAAGLADPDQDEHGKVLEAARRPTRVRHSAANLDNDF